ncbi:hypothetical protein A2153_05850 [Candidatus Gottesmanbacteria bacterium RBG_16_38_7b]|uniref:Uncharacterized protein n=1 Tax=Candidatus Gottesmanbacteria bacterium RBG_16_38_7b TaxID=1798372 RepID=A0A1F5YLA8_9BACT|nr:MAG: hypothetical protein A2153_05850 [Candidatus Gottesmanbacteria bacterium RBG_16_38_7b]
MSKKYFLIIIFISINIIVSYMAWNFLDYRSKALVTDIPQSIKLGTFDNPGNPAMCPDCPVCGPVQSSFYQPVGDLPTITPPVQIDSPPPQGKQYCVDEAPGTVEVESCDDSTRCDVAHGAGGPSGTCGTVIGWEHTIIEFLLGSTGKYNNRLSDNLSQAIQSSCYTALPYSPYISTFNVIDSYNLAGFHEFSRGSQAAAAALVDAWRATSGYTVSSSANGLTSGDAVLFGNPAHVALVNTVEIDSRGNGDIWFLHTGATYYLGKLIVANWQVVASSTGDNNVLFGSHQSKGPNTTIGETVCYCGSDSICYQWKFN